MKNNVLLKIFLALLPAAVFTQNYAWMTSNKMVGVAFLILWALMVWSVWQLTEKYHIMERFFRQTEIAFFLLPISSIILMIVFGTKAVSGTTDQFEQAGAAIGTAIGGTFAVGLAFVIGLLGGIIMHLITGSFDKKAEKSGVKQPETFSNKYGTSLPLVGVLVLAFVLSAVSSAGESVSDTPSSGRYSTLGNSAQTEPVAQKQELIAMKLQKKGFTKADFMKRTYQDTIDFTIDFTNNTQKEVRAFTGYITFSDLFDRKIMDMTLTYEKGLEPGETKAWDGEMEYNQFMDSHERLASIDQKDLKAILTLQQVIYADGTKDEF